MRHEPIEHTSAQEYERSNCEADECLLRVG